jgi:hypothetical protein
LRERESNEERVQTEGKREARRRQACEGQADSRRDRERSGERKASK